MANLFKSIIVDGVRVEVEMSNEEQAEFEKLLEQDQAVRQAILNQKQALLDKLGLTADEAKLLLG